MLRLHVIICCTQLFVNNEMCLVNYLLWKMFRGRGGGVLECCCMVCSEYLLFSSCAIIHGNDPFIQWREKMGTPIQNANVRVQTLIRCLYNSFDIWANFDAFGRNQQRGIYTYIFIVQHSINPDDYMLALRERTKEKIHVYKNQLSARKKMCMKSICTHIFT